MSAFIGGVKGPHHNSPHDASEVWADKEAVTVNLFAGQGSERSEIVAAYRRFDPIAARNFAALLVRASEEVERMRARQPAEQP